MAKKIFYNALSYSHEFGGWFICEWHNYEYKNTTKKPIFITEIQVINGKEVGVLAVNNDPEVQAFLEERKNARLKLHEELLEIAASINPNYVTKYQDDTLRGEIVLEEEDGKKLHEALIAKGWEKQFIPIGP